MRWIFVALASVWMGAAWAEDAGTLVVVGQGAVDVAPDMATITVGVRTSGETAADALRANSVATGELLTLLSEMGTEQEDMQTSNLSLSPVMDDRVSGQLRKIVGYQVSNTVTLQVRELGDLGVILDDIVQSGANEFYGLMFGLQDPQPVQDDARRLAVADARRKAQLYAKAAGLVLGPILSLQEGSRPVESPAIGAPFAARASAVPIATGEVGVSSQVTIVYSISGG